ncbi:hypothetical protein ANANG_G00070860 [Anguilla anguilla]|uniref:Ependymin-like 1 n=1 Tax=Anguilla anguilla TaxID=7936 RepID=A0A9D3S3D5_ANGAN|nr:hypothetical protein ANANG_G00070860 [Anguilla anguilla]
MKGASEHRWPSHEWVCLRLSDTMQAPALAFLCLCLAGSSWAQKPRPCASPPLQVGSFSSMDGKGNLATYGKYRYDALGQKVRFSQMRTYENRTTTVDLLVLFNERVLYQIDWLRFSCKKKALSSEFQPMEVPRDATLMGQVVVGTASAFGQGLLVNTWVGHDAEKNGTYMAVFTGIGCLPVSAMYHKEETGWTMLSFFNILLGIDDPQVFFPPAFCKYAPLEGTTNVFDAILDKDLMQE